MISKFVAALELHGRASHRLDLPAIAANKVCDFLKKSDSGKFPGLNREDIGVGIIMRLADPGIID